MDDKVNYYHMYFIALCWLFSLQDEEIHMLEKEIADLAKEKVTITKLAGDDN